MYKFHLLLLIVVSITAAPVKEQESVETAAVLHGIDTTKPISITQADCLYKNGFVAGFFRIGYKGQNDPTGVQNVQRAVGARLKFEVYLTPDPSAAIDRQLSGPVAYARSKGLTFDRIWLQVTSPIEWNKNQAINARLVSDFIMAGRRLNLKVGLYTNWYDYEQITVNSRAIPNTDIWYWHVNNPGPSGEGSPDHSDYKPFGPFSGGAIAKQYAISTSHCGLLLNKNSFPTSLHLQSGLQRKED